METARRVELFGLLCSAILSFAGCGGESARSPAAVQRTSLDAGTGQPAAYPPGGWRQLGPGIDDYYVSLAHILVAHDESDVGAWAASWPWLEPWPTPKRTPDEARSLAENLAGALRSGTADFGEIARELSDDRITQPHDGKLGVMRALNVLPELLDAYEALEEGEVSRPFASPAGYHIIQRTQVPAEEVHWSRRIMIMYAPVPAGWTRGGRVVTRSRSEAHALARQLLERLRATPERFASFVEEYSDDIFAEVGGNMGPRSNLDGTLDVATRLALAALEPMAISGVLDELGGYAIVQRLPPAAIERRAFEAFVITYDGAARGNAAAELHRTEAEARELAAQVARSLSQHPDQFAAASAQFCAEGGCGRDRVFTTDGSTFPSIYRELAKLPVGAVSSRFDACPSGFMIYRRTRPAKGDGPTVGRVFTVNSARTR